MRTQSNLTLQPSSSHTLFRKTEAKEREAAQKKLKKQLEEERKEAEKWVDDDKEAQKKAERKVHSTLILL